MNDCENGSVSSLKYCTKTHIKGSLIYMKVP
nr:MAG TPA: hypothetical protein [Caudoviricetes sp.]